MATSHIGSHDTLADAYARLQAGLEEHGRDAAGAGWEVYEWIDPAVEPNPASWPAPITMAHPAHPARQVNRGDQRHRELHPRAFLNP